MLWNKKRLPDTQVYKIKGSEDFLIAYGEYFNTNSGMAQETFCAVGYDPEPNYNCFCHSSASIGYLHESCYPVSQKVLKDKYPKWHDFFNSYLMED